MAQINFNANEVEPTAGFEPLPAGDYVAAIVQSEMKATKAGDGQYLQLNWQVLEGEYKNRIVFDRLNLHNRNETAVKIAQGTLSAICRAVGVMTPQDSSQLHDIPCRVKVRLTRDQNGDLTNNEIVKYEPIGGATHLRTQPEQGQQPGQAPQAANQAPPWQR